ncbi:MAG: hypothetical protein LBV01_01725 [Deltaproteobacteria bacterium]|jgi:hypothetical protein|nr:hypothetical protein [Deltaproteobacteria bacterium]
METQRAPQMETPVASSFNIGSILSRSFSTLMKRPLLFFGLTLLVSMPIQVMPTLLGISDLERGGGLLFSFLLQVVGFMLNTAIQGAIAYGVFQVLRGYRPGFGEALSRGLVRIIPLGIAAILGGLGIGLGFLLVIVPGVLLWCMWAVVAPVCTIEKLGPIASLKRSAALTKGCRLQVFCLGLITYLLLLAIGAATSLLFLALAFSIHKGIALLAVGAITAIPGAFMAVVLATLYYDLRAVKEGVTLDALAAVFD